MFRIAVVCGILALAVGVDLDADWQEFKTTYGKNYANKVEESIRRRIWSKHVQVIEEHNLAFANGDSTFWMGPNEYMDMHHDEFVKTMNTYPGRTDHGSNLVYQGVSDGAQLPDTVDWRKKGYVTEVKNQAQCGSCWAFSTTGSLEGQWFNKTQKLVSLSEQNLVDCATKQGNKGCEGGLMDQAFTYIKDNGGIDTEASYPYKGEDGTCKFKAADIGAKLTGFVDVKSKDEGALQAAVAEIGPISVAIDANHMAFQLYKGGVYHNWFCSETALDHGVLAAGYGVYQGKDYWLVKNSWGKTWGMEGYIMMSRNRHNNCGIATQASYPTV